MEGVQSLLHPPGWTGRCRAGCAPHPHPFSLVPGRLSALGAGQRGGVRGAGHVPEAGGAPHPHPAGGARCVSPPPATLQSTGAFPHPHPDPCPRAGGVLCVTYAVAVGTGISYFQYADIDSGRNIFIVGFAMFMALLVPRWLGAAPAHLATGIGGVPQGGQSLSPPGMAATRPQCALSP